MPRLSPAGLWTGKTGSLGAFPCARNAGAKHATSKATNCPELIARARKRAGFCRHVGFRAGVTCLRLRGRRVHALR